MKSNVGPRRAYQIQMRHPLSMAIYWKEVVGYKVDIQGFEEYVFFLHRGPERIMLRENLWRITEMSTGFAFPRETDGSIRQRAIDKVTEFLASKGKDKFIRAVAKAQEISRRNNEAKPF